MSLSAMHHYQVMNNKQLLNNHWCCCPPPPTTYTSLSDKTILGQEHGSGRSGSLGTCTFVLSVMSNNIARLSPTKLFHPPTITTRSLCDSKALSSSTNSGRFTFFTNSLLPSLDTCWYKQRSLPMQHIPFPQYLGDLTSGVDDLSI